MPSLKRIIPSLLIATLLVAGSWYLTTKTGDNVPQVAGVRKANFAVTEIDTDGDGLMDWEERLWKTDPRNVDSDGDGTTDGDEVAASRDPAVAGPNDSTKEVTLSENEGIKIIAEDKNLNVSEAVSRSIFSAYMASKNNGGVSGSQLEALGILMAEKLPAQTVYTLSDLNLSQISGPEALRLYGNNLAAALTPKNPLEEGELTIFARAINENDPKQLAGLDVVTKNLEEMTKSALDVAVPSAAASAHLSIITSLGTIKYDIEGMKLIFSDPMLAFMALNGYRHDSDTMTQNIATLKKIFTDAGVTFGSTEAGYKLFGK